MADLASSAVTVRASFPLRDGFGKSRFESVRDLTVVLAAQGDGSAGSNIPAAALGFSAIYSVESITKSDNSIILVGAPKTDGSAILLKAAGTGAPAQYTGTFNMRVRGRLL